MGQSKRFDSRGFDTPDQGESNPRGGLIIGKSTWNKYKILKRPLGSRQNYIPNHEGDIDSIDDGNPTTHIVLKFIHGSRLNLNTM